MLDATPGTILHNRHYVEACVPLGCMVMRNKRFSGAADLLLLGCIHRLFGGTGGSTVTPLHLDEDNRLSVHRDDIDFSARGAIVPLDNTVPEFAQMTLGHLFAFASEPKSRRPGKHTAPSRETAQERV